MNADKKLLNNTLDEIKRLKSQLEDLETYKDDFPPEEAEQIKKDTLDQLMETQKRLEKLQSGESSVKSEAEKAMEEINRVLCENYNTKDILNIYLNAETKFLRQNLTALKDKLALKSISKEEFTQNAIIILDFISKKNELNAEEKVLYEDLKKGSMSHLEQDKGIDQSKLEQKVNKK